MTIVHETDMPWVYEGKAAPPDHFLPIIRRLTGTAGVVLQREGWLEWADRPDRHTSVVMPPGWGKTTLLQYFYEWLIGRASIEWGKGWADRLHLAHVSHSADQAWRVSFAVRDTIQTSAVYHAIFPKVKPHPEKFSEREWRVQGCTGINPTFVGMGVRGPLLGLRLNFLGMDDLVKQPDEDAAGYLSDAEVRDINQWIEMTAMTRLVPGGTGWLNATRWMENDPTGWTQVMGWAQILVPALNEEDESNWPERTNFTTETLHRMRDRNPEQFSLQYMGNPMPQAGALFRPEFFQDEFDALPAQLNLKRITSWDTAGTVNRRSDYTAGWTAAVDVSNVEHGGWPHIYLFNLYHDKLEFPDLLDAIVGQQMMTRSDYVLIEDKATGQPAAQMLKAKGLPIVARKPPGERGQTRLADVENQAKPLLAGGFVHFPSKWIVQSQGLSWVSVAKQQLYSYPRARHDDIARSLIQLLYFIVEGVRDDTLSGRALPRPKRMWGLPRGKKVLT